MPICWQCGGTAFYRDSLFAEQQTEIVTSTQMVEPDLVEGFEGLRPSLYFVFSDGKQQHIFELQDEWTRIGRSASCDIRLDDPTVSRRHAIIHRRGELVNVLDDRSLNGVYVNGELAEQSRLSGGDEIVIGRFRMVFLDLLGSHHKGDAAHQFRLKRLLAA